MAHRGRLNVLVNTLGKMPANLFAEFEGKQAADLSAGDVKYHQGFSSDVVTPGGPMHLTLAFNPSHLEIADPVVEGSVRARQDRRRDPTCDQVMPVLIHGDAAIAGQGVVQETLNLAQTRGYRTGGTIHIVVNNQIGFTTSDPRDTRGTLYCTDVAKMVEAPIFHVNGDDPEACLLAVEMAIEFRQKFDKDVFIDLVCFPPAGAQRGRRADDHPAADVQEHPSASRDARTVRRAAGRGGNRHRGRGRSDDRDLSHGHGQGLPHQHHDPVQLQAAVRGRLGPLRRQALDRRRRHARCR